MLCQVCGAQNANEREFCQLCHQKLMVVSGVAPPEEEEEDFASNPEEQFSFDEHLLERISILEEVVKRTTESIRQILGSLYKLEQQILVNQTGVTTLRDLLEDRQVITWEEWSELWESRMDHQLRTLEKRERFAAVKEHILGLYSGEDAASFQEMLDEAESSLVAFDIGGALQTLDAAHRHDPANHELSFFLAEIFFNEGDGDLALDYFRKLLAAKPDHLAGLVYTGVLQHERSRFKKAEKLLKKAVAHYPDHFLPAFSLGAVYAAEGRFSEAVALLERAVELDPLPQASYLLGGCLYDMGRSGVAIRHLRQAVRLDPAFRDAHQLLGLACLERRWYKKALEALSDAERLHPARLQYRELVELMAPPEPIDGEEFEAEPARAALPAEAAELLRQAEASLESGDARQALSSYRRALGQEPDHPLLLVTLAAACLEIGNAVEIEPLVDKIIELEPGERLRAAAWATLLEALRFLGKYREGNRVGRRLLSESSSELERGVASFEMAMNLADVEEDLNEALLFARQAVEFGPEEIQRFSLAALGWVHYKRREFSQAVDCLSRSNKLGPVSSRTLTHLGMALLAAGEREAAHEVLSGLRDRQTGRTALEEKVLECLMDGASRFRESMLRP